MGIVRIYGPGCARCRKVEEMVRQAVGETNPDFRVEKITDIQEIISLGVLSTPAISVDGVVKSSGRIPEPEEIRQWLLP